MRLSKILLSLILFTSMIITSLPFESHVDAISNYVTANKTVSPSTINSVGEEAEVTLNITGTPPSNIVRPNDVVLIIDHSGSMQADNRLDAAKKSAKEFIDLMDLSTHRIGIVDFGTDASTLDLTQDATAAKSYVDGITIDGSTETGLAIRKAQSMLTNHRPDAQPTIVIMTDGAANNSTDALNSAKAAKDSGVVFYSIALLGPLDDPNTSAPNQLLKEMSTSASHHHFVLGSIGLSDIYKQIVKEIGVSSAYDLTITDKIDSNFELVPGSAENNIPKPTINGNTLTWKIKELKADTISLSYKIRAVNKDKIGIFPAGTTDIQYNDYSGKALTASTINPNVTVKYPAPVISSIDPASGHVDGGEKISIKGDFFQSGIKVYFGETEAINTSLVTTHEILVTTPPGIQGETQIKVENTDGQKDVAPYSYYADPSISMVTPNSGKLSGGERIAIIGANFMPGAKVKINNVEAQTSYTFSTKLYAIVPPGSNEGKVTVKVENPDGTEVKLVDGYTYLAPPPPPKIEIQSVTPNNGETTGGNQVYVIGSNFDPSVKVYFDDNEASVDYYGGASKVRVTVPSGGDEGAVSVRVVNPDGTEGILVNGYTYFAPPPPPKIEIQSVTPNNGEITGGNQVYVTGANFDPNVKVYFGNKEASVNYFANASKVRVNVPASINEGLVNVRVENPDGTTAELQNAYEYLLPPPKPAPLIDHLTPAEVKTNESKPIYIFGENFSPDSKVYFGSDEVAVQFVTTSKIRVYNPPKATGQQVDVKLINPDAQESTIVNGFTYIEPAPEPAPTIISLSAVSGSVSGGEKVTITGTNFTNYTKFKFGDKYASALSQTFISSSEIEVVVPLSTSVGLVDVVVQNSDGQTATLAAAYSYEGLSPTITSLHVYEGPVSGGTYVYIYGTNFNGNMNITVDGIEVPYTYFNTGRIRIKTPKASSPGVVDIVVDRGGLTAITQFTYK